jgi:hypothetical protein
MEIVICVLLLTAVNGSIWALSLYEQNKQLRRLLEDADKINREGEE